MTDPSSLINLVLQYQVAGLWLAIGVFSIWINDHDLSLEMTLNALFTPRNLGEAWVRRKNRVQRWKKTKKTKKKKEDLKEKKSPLLEPIKNLKIIWLLYLILLQMCLIVNKIPTIHISLKTSLWFVERCWFDGSPAYFFFGS